MALTLYLLRHAEAEKEKEKGSDFERVLTPHGELSAQTLGKRLTEQSAIPDVIIASSAVRALTTAQLIADQLPEKKTVKTEPTLYNAELNTLLNILQQVEPQYQQVMLVGHNPGISLLFNELAAQYLPSLSTCGLYILTFQEPNWQAISAHSGTVIALNNCPKNNPAGSPDENHTTRDS